MTSPISPTLSAALMRLVAATEHEARWQVVTEIAALAGDEGESGWAALVDALPTLPTEPQQLLAVALAQQASSHPSPALTRGMLWLMSPDRWRWPPSSQPGEEETVVFDHYVSAAPELVRPMLVRLAQTGIVRSGDKIEIPHGTLRPAGGVTLSRIFGNCRNELLQCLSDSDPGVRDLALRALGVMSGGVVGDGKTNKATQHEQPRLIIARAPSEWQGQSLVLELRSTLGPAPLTGFVVQPGGDVLLASSARAVHRLAIDSGEHRADACRTATEARCLALSADGELAAWVRSPQAGAGTEDSVELSRRGSGVCERLMGVPAGSVTALAFSGGGLMLALMGVRTRVIELASRREKSLPMQMIAYAPQGDRAAITTARGSTQLWRMRNSEPERTIETQGVPTILAFSRDAAQLASATATELLLTDCGSGRPLLRAALELAPEYLAFNADGSRVACQRTATSLAIWDIATGTICNSVFVDNAEVTGLAFRGNDLMVGRRSTGVLEVWALERASVIERMRAGRARWHTCRQISFVSEEHLRFIACPDGSPAVEVFTLGVGGAPLARTPIATAEPSSHYCADGSHAVERMPEDRDAYDAHGYLGEIELFATGQRGAATAPSQRVAWTGKSLSAVTLSPDGSRIAAASCDDELAIFDAITGAMQTRLVCKGRSGKIVLLALNDECTRLAAASDDGRVEVWGPAVEASIGEIQFGRPPLGMAFSPHEHLLAVALADASVEVWSTAGGVRLARVEGLAHQASCVAFSPSGQQLAAAGHGPHAWTWQLALVTPSSIRSKTEIFLGDSAQRLRCRITAGCISGFSGGWQVFLDGDGSCVVVVLGLPTQENARILQQLGKSGLWERCYRLTLTVDSAQALFTRCLDADLAGQQFGPLRVSVPGEPWVALTLFSASGTRLTFGKPKGVDVPALDAIVNAISQLARGLEQHTPEYEGATREFWTPWKATKQQQ